MSDNTLTPGQERIVAGSQARTAAHLEGKSPAFLAAYDRAVGGATYRNVRPPTRIGGPGVIGGSQAPVSEQFLRGQHRQKVMAEVAEWHDHASGTARYVNTAAGPVSAEQDALAFLRAHGLAAIDADGDEVMPSAAQARGLVGAYIDRMQREAVSNGQGWGSVTFSDANMPPRTRTVSARRIV